MWCLWTDPTVAGLFKKNLGRHHSRRGFPVGLRIWLKKLSHKVPHSYPWNLQTRPPQSCLWMSSLVWQVASLYPPLAAGGELGGCTYGLCSHLRQEKLVGVSGQEGVCSQIQVCSREKRDFVVTAFPVILSFCFCSTESLCFRQTYQKSFSQNPMKTDVPGDDSLLKTLVKLE